MKWTKYILAALLLSTTLVACNNFEEDVTPSGEFNVTVSAEHTNSEYEATRTAISADGTLSWINSDVIGIYAGDIQANRAFSRKPTGGFMGSFLSKGQSDCQTTYYAYYPHSGSNNGYVVTAELPTIQDGVFSGVGDFMVAEPVTATYSESKEITNLNFNFDSESHLFSILHLRLADNSLKALAEEKVLSLRISSEGNTLSGTFTTDIRNPHSTLNFTSSKEYVEITFASGLPTLNEMVDVWAVVAPTESNKAIDLTLEITTMSGKAVFETASPVSLPASKIKELPIIYVCDKWEQNANLNSAFEDDVLLEYVLGIADRNGDGILTSDEVEGISEVNINGMNVGSLKGLEVFPNLTTLKCSATKIKTFTLKSPSLTILDIGSNVMSGVDLSGVPALQTLLASGLNTNTLNLSPCKQLNTVDFASVTINNLTLNGLTKLPTFAISGTVKNLSLANCSLLQNLDLVSRGLMSLDVSGCSELTSLDCYDNSNLTTLKLTGCTKLSSIMCRQCAFTSLDLSGLSSLTVIYCQRNPLVSLNVSGCVSLDDFYGHTCNWVELDFSSCTNIRSIDIRDTPTVKKIIIPASKSESILNLSGCGSPSVVKK